MIPEHLAHFPIGRDIPLRDGSVVGWEIFPFAGDLSVKRLDAPVLPEPPRMGESGPQACDICRRDDADFLWSDDHWLLEMFTEPASLPTLLLWPRAHHDLDDLPDDLLAGLGPMMRRVESALKSLDGVARVHVSRWGDGAAHLHWWFMARPAGLPQLRGSCMPFWDDVLPPMPADRWTALGARIGQAMS
ncbi:hypothetical protein GCM10027589_27840 [Actinocorallia lasiicapitis]